MKRTFIAIKIELSLEFRTILNRLKESLGKEQIRWVSAENLHLTLQFLGDTVDDEIDKVNDILLKLADQTNSFDFWLKGLSSFNHRGKPGVLFLGVSANELLPDFVTKLNERLSEIGFVMPPKPFKPHLTLARMKSLKDRLRFNEILRELDEGQSQTIRVKEIIFYESILKSTGPQYEPIQIYKLRE